MPENEIEGSQGPIPTSQNDPDFNYPENQDSSVSAENTPPGITPEKAQRRTELESKEQIIDYDLQTEEIEKRVIDKEQLLKDVQEGKTLSRSQKLIKTLKKYFSLRYYKSMNGLGTLANILTIAITLCLAFVNVTSYETAYALSITASILNVLLTDLDKRIGGYNPFSSNTYISTPDKDNYSSSNDNESGGA